MLILLKTVSQKRIYQNSTVDFVSYGTGMIQLNVTSCLPFSHNTIPETAEFSSQNSRWEIQDTVISPEKAEEAKLKARYPNLGNKPGGSDLLRKRLQKGQKYFDSGDYNMAKAKIKNKQLPTAAPEKTEITGDHIPTPQDLPQRKPSLVASKLAG
uniref:cAMP regulated phosphoprotein 19 n=1 Tax=Mola mola TaxID=94237 RepID=A0A3Q3VV73_MOLML